MAERGGERGVERGGDRGGFGHGFGGRGGGRGGPRGRGRRAGRAPEEEIWVSVTKLGRLVKPAVTSSTSSEQGTELSLSSPSQYLLERESAILGVILAPASTGFFSGDGRLLAPASTGFFSGDGRLLAPASTGFFSGDGWLSSGIFGRFFVVRLAVN
ncbi:hypothetical protein ISN45_Aa04g003010 [Arabidopsis thaliana x Arabidopsis arenosa]|uniref:Uncharacterized protein n=1 Tax=Arabidopsis thaliana x Arabidopsis arenosa TaxID=1240361 RepID=A0A8T2A457_9BRAS|nr:hypothetical protein ISN45_Aa04g003010 [Arabidopsis thaliana x Arabidopsis arenosa]